jgi:hypothetical protein
VTRSIEQIRDHWLHNRSSDGAGWEGALAAVYDLAVEDCAALVSPLGHEGERDCREVALEVRGLKIRGDA